MTTLPRKLRTDDAERTLLMASACILIILTSALLIQLNSRGKLEMTYCAVAAVLVLSSLVFLHQPFVTLSLTLVYLISPAPMILAASYSAVVTVLLIISCFVGTVLASGSRSVFQGGFARIPFLLCSIAAIGAALGIAKGNQAATALGDFYQVFEFSALFFLARTLIKTEEQFRALAHVIVGAIIVVSILEMADALMGAEYLPGLSNAGNNLPRTINMNAPIAFVALLATVSSARNKKWILAGIGILAVNLLWSFTRGLWMASAASALFLLVVQPGKSRRVLLQLVFASSVIAIPLLYALGLGSIVVDRVYYTTQQFGSPTIADDDDQTLAERRVIEYILILPRIAEHPVLGSGLGATFEISGDAVLEGPKGEKVDHHYIHNLYMLIAFRLGIPVLIVFLVALWKYFRRAIGNLRSLDLSPSGSALMAGLIAAIFGEALLSLTSPTLLNHPTAGVLGCIMASTTTVLRTNSRKTASPSPAG